MSPEVWIRGISGPKNGHVSTKNLEKKERKELILVFNGYFFKETRNSDNATITVFVQVVLLSMISWVFWQLNFPCGIPDRFAAPRLIHVKPHCDTVKRPRATGCCWWVSLCAKGTGSRRSPEPFVGRGRLFRRQLLISSYQPNGLSTSSNCWLGFFYFVCLAVLNLNV